MSTRGQAPPLRLPHSVPERVDQPVRVAVDFVGPTVRPLAFMWSGRKYIVKRVNLVYKRQHGSGFHWCFAVSDEANSYVLRYDPVDMRWTLEEVYAL